MEQVGQVWRLLFFERDQNFKNLFGILTVGEIVDKNFVDPQHSKQFLQLNQRLQMNDALAIEIARREHPVALKGELK